MINIIDKTKCCGCAACEQICPRSCIKMVADEQGFLYPSVNLECCVDCGLCEKKCPVLNPFDALECLPSSYAGRVSDENIRKGSSSGGVFTVIATEILNKGGYVFGACFNDDWTVSHKCITNISELYKLRGSKYVQSEIGSSYKEAKKYLKDGKWVLFSGTPCQIAGLNHFLGRVYSTLLTVDVVCHSAPSPLVWDRYLASLMAKNNALNKSEISITFRNKENGWHNYGLLIKDNTGDIVNESSWYNNYMQGFLQDLYTRPSCSFCPARQYRSHSDIMLADFWGVEKYHPEWDDNRGLSLILLKTEKARLFFDSIATQLSLFDKIPYSEVEDRGLHAPIMENTAPHPLRSYFWKRVNKDNINVLISRCLRIGNYYKKSIEGVKNLIRPLWKILKK